MQRVHHLHHGLIINGFIRTEEDGGVFLAAGKPILMDFETKYNPVEQYQAGIILNSLSGEAAAQTLQRMAKWPEEEYARNCQNARRAAGDFDFKKLTDKLLNIIESLPERKS